MRKFIAVESGKEGKWIVGLENLDINSRIAAGHGTVTGLAKGQCQAVINMLEYVYKLGRNDKISDIEEVLKKD